MNRDLTGVRRVRAGDHRNTAAEKRAAVRAICDARSVRDAADARHIMTVLGLLEPAAEASR